MVKAQRKIKIKWKNLLAGLLAFLAIVGSIVGIAALATKDTKRVRAMAFSRGVIDADGNFVKSNQSIYTEEFLECQGLTITPDYEASGTYQVYYYDEEKSFIGATDVMSANDGVYEKDSSFVGAKYARIVITPDVSVYAEEGEEFKIRFWQVAKYARDYTITVDKKQHFEFVNLFAVKEDMADKSYRGSVGKQVEIVGNEGFVPSEEIDVKNMEIIKIFYFSEEEIGIYNYFFLDADGVVLEGDNNLGKLASMTLEVPENAESFVFSVVMGHTCVVNQLK